LFLARQLYDSEGWRFKSFFDSYLPYYLHTPLPYIFFLWKSRYDSTLFILK
jgi:hypothetical protein